MSVCFPKELRSFFQSIEPKDNQELESLFNQNEAVKHAFISWVQAHQSVVAGTPYLFRAFEIANKGNLDCKISDAFDKRIVAIVSEVLSTVDQLGEFPDGYLEHSLLLFESGMIDKEKLTKLLSCCEESGRYPLNFQTMNKIIPILERFNFSEFKDFVSIDYGRGLILHEPLILRKTLNLMKEFTFEQLKELFSIQEPKRPTKSIVYEGGTVLHYLRLFREISPLLEKFTPAQLTEIFSIQDRDGNRPLHFKHVFDNNFRFWETLNFNQLKYLLSIQDNEGQVCFNYLHVFTKIYPFLSQNFDEIQLAEFFSIQNQQGETPLHNFEIVKGVISVLKNFNEESFVKVFAIKDINLKTPLHNSKIVAQLLPLLIERSSASLNDLFTIQDCDGNTPLHDPSALNHVIPLFDKLSEEVWNIRNRAGSRPGEEPILSLEWLKKFKERKNLKPLSKSKYAEKANKLKQTIDQVWNSFVFGNAEGQIPKEYLALEISGKPIEEYSPEEIKKQIDCVIDKIVAKTPWRGTPKAEKVDELHLFYNQMLRNFEELVSFFTEKNRKEQVGFLTGIAKAEMEGRCAVAYQAEIAQASVLLKLDSDPNLKPSTTQAGLIFNSRAEDCLFDFIENLAQRDYEGNSHATTQLLYATGLALAPDPDPILTVEKCLEVIYNECEPIKYASKFKDFFKPSDNEFLEEWFHASTPETFGEAFFQKQKELEEKEKIIIESSEQALKSITRNETIVQLFQSPQWGALKLPFLEKKDLDEAVFNQLSKTLTLQDIEEAEAMQYESSAANRATMIKLQDTVNTSKKLESSWDEKQKTDYADLLKAKQALQKSIMDQKSEFIKMKYFAEARVKLKHLTDGLKLSGEDFEKIVDEKANFDLRMLTLATNNQINFKAGESGLPSKAVERVRRQAYTAQFLDEEGLNEKGAIEILKKIQVLISLRDTHK